MTRRPPSSTRTSTPFPYTTLFRSLEGGAADDQAAADLGDRLDLDQPVFLERAPRRDEIDDARREAQRRRQFNRTVQFDRSEEHTSELQSLMRTSYAVFCVNKNKQNT